MTPYYEARYCYVYHSKLVDQRRFASSDEARAFDREEAIAICTQQRIATALRDGDAALVAALKLLADEIQAVEIYAPRSAMELL